MVLICFLIKSVNAVVIRKRSVAMPGHTSTSLHDDSELWGHLQRISEIVQTYTKSEEKCDRHETELEQLRTENRALIEQNEKLLKRIKLLEEEKYDDSKNEHDNSRMLLTQDTILSEPEQLEAQYNDDPDLTDASPVKSQNINSSQSFQNDDQPLMSNNKRRLFEDQLLLLDSKKIKLESQSDDGNGALKISQVDDSQGSNTINSASIMDNIEAHLLKNNNSIIKLNLTSHPKLNRPWYPEDFIKNPEYEKLITDRSVNVETLPAHISNHFKRQMNHIQNISMKEFNHLANGRGDNNADDNGHKYDDYNDANKENYDGKSMLITPPQDTKRNFSNSLISPLYKFEINEQNLGRYLKYFPNLLRTKRVRNWDIEDSMANDECADFLLTQEVQGKNKKAKERAQLRGLRMLFQSCFVVEDKKQIGTHIFRNNIYNKKVLNSDFVIDISIFE